MSVDVTRINSVDFAAPSESGQLFDTHSNGLIEVSLSKPPSSTAVASLLQPMSFQPKAKTSLD